MSTTMHEKIIIYTDGAAKGNPGPAGWGAVFLDGSAAYELGGSVPHATNNQMELTAAIEALKFLKQEGIRRPVEILADSKYVVLGITEWIAGWMRNGWRNAAKKPVMNRELWEELHALALEFRPSWGYVKGHHEDPHNNRADQIASDFAEGLPVDLRRK